MVKDIMSHQTALNCHLLQPSCLILKAIASQSGGKKLAKKKQTVSAKEQALAVQNFILLWNLISLIRKSQRT